MLRRRVRGGQVAVALAALVAASCAPSAVVAPPASRAPAGVVHVELEPARAVLPLRAQHLLVATVRDDAGRPVPGVAVSWVLVAGSAGVLAAVDGGDGRPARALEGLREAATITATLPYELVLEAATCSIGVGQTWCVVSAEHEGDGEILAYLSRNPDPLWGEARAHRSWVDAVWQWPLDAMSAAGTPHTLATRVLRATDDAPLVGHVVTYEVVAGDAAASFADAQSRVTTVSDATGVASATLVQDVPRAGWCEVRATLRAPATETGGEGRLLATHVVRKTWTPR